MAKIVKETGRIYDLADADGENLGAVTVTETECLLDISRVGWTSESLKSLGVALLELTDNIV